MKKGGDQTDHSSAGGSEEKKRKEKAISLVGLVRPALEVMQKWFLVVLSHLSSLYVN